MTEALKFLAFDTSTDTMSVAVSRGAQTWHYQCVGGANASAQLIPVIQDLLGQAKMSLNELTALVMGHGPGSFTGLRTACSVAQGLALGAHLKVVQMDTLMAVAEEARLQLASDGNKQVHRVGVLVDARMSEVYAGAYEWQPEFNAWQSLMPLQVGTPEAMLESLQSLPQACEAWAGNGWTVYKERLNLSQHLIENAPAICATATPHALALLRMAPHQWARGHAVAPDHVHPLYIRDKVAQTTAEREAIKASKLAV